MQITPQSFSSPLAPKKEQDSASDNSVDYEAFLKILTTQLSNQDPTAPMDSTQYIAQIAQFSQVEQSVQTNDRLEALFMSSNLDLANSVIGRNLTASDGTISGIVESVRITESGAVAELEDGRKITLESGVTIA